MAETATHIGDLKPDPRNARKHTPRNHGMIADSIQRDGFGRSVLLARDGTIIAGNATIDAAASAGMEDVIVVETDGTKVVAVKRTDVAPDSPAFRNLALSDNRAAELADWDPDVLRGLAEEVDLSAFWFEPELETLLASLDAPNFEPVGIDEQGRLDEKAQATCPECGHVFAP